jgi:Protein of unknown function (DUF3631)
MSATELVQRLNAKRSGEGWKAKCPGAHNDRVPSLSIKEGSDGRVLLHCHAGCSIDDILRAIGLARRDLFPTGSSLAPRQATATEPYPHGGRAPEGVGSPGERQNPPEAKPASICGDEGEAIRQLSTLPLLEYDRRREDEAKRLNCRTSTLDKLVEAERLAAKKNEGELQGEAVIFPDVAPWPEPVSGSETLSAISASLTAYCALPDGAADMIALWCAHTHCFELFRISPRLNITSPTYGCGKSTLRDAIALFVRRSLSAESLSTAVGFRVVNESKPTLLADEIDRWLINNEELCGFFNSNYKRGAVFLRCDPDDGNKVKAFNAYSPVVLCGIGALRGRLATLHDRSIVIRMERAKPGELLAPFDEGRTEKEQELNRKLVRWMSDNRARIASCNARLPDGVHNRLADNWRPLFSIAEVLGGDWPNRCAESFKKLTAKKLDVEARGIELLRDIRDILAERGENVVNGWISSSDLIACLLDKSESPWGEANKGGKPINERWLSVRLADYEIKPGKLPREENGQKRGYKVTAFQNAFARYVPSGQVSQQPILRGKMGETDSETDRKPQVSHQVSHQVSQQFTRENGPRETDGHLGSPENTVLREAYPTVKIIKLPEPGDEKAHGHLVSVTGVLETESRDGLFPKGHPDCQWGYIEPGEGDEPGDSPHYPNEYTAALDHIRHGCRDDQRAFGELSRLLYKIDCEEQRNQPLCSNYREWREGSYPPEYVAARAYVKEKRNETEENR